MANITRKTLESDIISINNWKNNTKKRRTNKMAVIIKLNGVTIGATTMTTSEIRNAENAGFTILTQKEGR